MSIKSRVAEWLLGDEYKAADISGAVPVYTTGAASTIKYTQHTARSLSQAGYASNITVFRAVNVLAQACASMEWQVFTKGNKREELPDHPIAQLLSQPNTEQSKGNFIAELVSYWLISGTEYLFGSFPNGSRTPFGLYNLRPDLIEPVVPEGGQLTGWKYGEGQQTITYPLWKIKTIKFFHPLDPLHGLSPLQVAASVIERQNSGEEWNFSLLKNMARPSGAFVANTEFSDEARARLKAEILKKYGRGSKTAGMPMLLENGLSYMQIALSPVEADWFNSDASAGRKIAAAIGVDPLLLNDKQYSTYNNSTEAKLALWELSGFPIMDMLADDLNLWLVPFFSPSRDIVIEYNKRPIEAMKRNRQLESITTISEWNNGIRSFNDTAEELGLEGIEEGMDFYRFGPTLFVKKVDIKEWLQQNADNRLLTLPSPIPPGMLPNESPPGTVTNIQEVPPIQQLPSPNESGGRGHQPKMVLKAQDERSRYYQFVEKVREPWYGLFEQAMISYFHSEELALKSVLKPHLSYSQITENLRTAQTLYSENLAQIFATYYANIATHAAQNIWQQFGMQKSSVKAETASLIASQVTQDLEYIKQTTHNDLGITIKKASELAGVEQSSDIIAQQALAALYDRYRTKRAAQIAINEVVLAYNLGAHIAALNTDMPLYKIWISARDEHVRGTHQMADGQKQPLASLYIVDGERLAFPHDTSYGAIVYNCRCVESFSQDLAV